MTTLGGIIDQGITLTPQGNMPVETVRNGHVCTTNSSSTPLGIGETFEGEWVDTEEYNNIIVGVSTDRDSAYRGLKIEWSADGITKHDEDTLTIYGDRSKVFTYYTARQYFRVRYVNGGVAQGVFNLQSMMKKGGIKASSHRLSDPIVGDDDVEIFKGVIAAEDENGEFVNIRAVQGQTGHNLKVSVDQIDLTTNALKTVNYSHAELHEGNHYFSKDYFTLGNGAIQDILIVTPDTSTWAHMIIEVGPQDGAAEMILYEDPTVSGNGILDNVRNRNRNMPDSNTTAVYYGPTVTTVGTKLEREYIGSGKAQGGVVRDSEEKIGRQDSLYLLRITNKTTSTNNINVKIDWYEHSNIQ